MKFNAKYDYDGKLSAAKRITYGNRAADNHYTCLFFHAGNMPMAKVKRDGSDRFLIERVDS